MRILFVSQEYPPAIGGAGVVAYQFAESLAESHQVTVLTKARERIPTSSAHIVAVRVPGGCGIPCFGMALRKLIPSSFDAIILNDIGAIVTAGATFSSAEISRCIVFLHGLEVEEMHCRPSLGHKLLWYPEFFKRTLKRCKNIAVVSDFLRHKIMSSGLLEGVDYHKCQVCYAGSDDSLFRILPTPPVRSAKEEVRILTVGRVTRGKGLLSMYEMFKSLPQNFSWRIVGDGDVRPQLSSLISADGLHDRVELHGPEQRVGLPKLFNSADIFFSFPDSSLSEEGFGLVFVEAALCGLPVIGHDYAGIREAVSPSSGFLVRTLEEARQVLLERGYLEFRREDVRAAVECFSLRKTTALLERLLHP